MKKVMFWASFPFTMVVYMAAGVIGTIADLVLNGILEWEKWCLR